MNEMPARETDLQELELLFIANHKILCNLANKILRDRSTAEDVVQDVFLRLWKKRAEIKIESTLKGYLYRAVANAALDELHKSKRLEFREEIEENSGPSPETNPEELSEELLEKRLKEAMDRLPPKCRTIFVLSRYEGLKHKEIAEQLDISLNTVETQIGIALDKLRRELKPFISSQYLVSIITSFYLVLSYLPID